MATRRALERDLWSQNEGDVMGIGQRIARLVSGGRAEEGDPGAMKEAGVVRLAEGPMLVERLRDRGIDATGIESVDPVSGIRSYMRIMVRQSDLAATHQVFEERDDTDFAGAALDELVSADGEDQDTADEVASQEAMSQLFLAADRLGNRPDDVELIAELERLREEVTDGPPPFGVEAGAWKRVAMLAVGVMQADEEADEDQVAAAAMALRDFLREYV